MTQDTQESITIVRLNSAFGRLDRMLFEIDNLPDDHGYAGEHAPDRINEETRR